MYVSSFKVEPAPGYYRERGLSHRARLTLSHPWPGPKWWGKHFFEQVKVDPLHPERSGVVAPKPKRPELFEAGAVVTATDAPQTAVWPQNGSVMGSWPSFDGADCVLDYFIGAEQMPAPPQALTFRGLYRLAGSEPLEVTREIRGPGQRLAISPDRNPRAKLWGIDATPWTPENRNPSSKNPLILDHCEFQFTMIDTRVPPIKDAQVPVVIYDVELQDESGRKWSGDSTSGLTLSWSYYDERAKKSWPAGQQLKIMSLGLAPAFKTQGKMTMRGKVSMDANWPIHFQVTLPPRVVAPLSDVMIGNFSIPLWRDGRPIKAPGK